MMNWSIPKHRRLEHLWQDVSLTTADIGKILGGYTAVAVKSQAKLLGLPDRRKMRSRAAIAAAQDAKKKAA